MFETHCLKAILNVVSLKVIKTPSRSFATGNVIVMPLTLAAVGPLNTNITLIVTILNTNFSPFLLVKLLIITLPFPIQKNLMLTRLTWKYCG